MRSQELQWVVVPYDARTVDGKTILRAAVSIQPKLEDDTVAPGTLQGWPDILDWPALVNGTTIGLTIDGKTVSPADIRRGPKASTEAWKAIFGKDTLVNPFEMRNLSEYRVFTYPVLTVSQAVRSVFATMAKEFPEGLPVMEAMAAPPIQNFTYGGPQTDNTPLPRAMELLKDLIPSTQEDERSKGIRRSFEEQARAVAVDREQPDRDQKERRPNKGALDMRVKSAPDLLFTPFDAKTPRGALLQAEMYHMARHTALPTKGKDGRSFERAKRRTPDRPEIDFHQAIGATREYPAVMRALGVVVDLEFVLPDGVDAKGWISAKVTVPAGLALPTRVTTPRTAYQLRTNGNPAYWSFLPRPDEGSDIKNGQFCLSDPALFGVTQIDVDAAAAKTLNYLRGIRHWVGRTRGVLREKRDAAPPAIRGTGLVLVRHGRGLRFAKAAMRNIQNHNRAVNGDEVSLYADDLSRGFRIDIFDQTAGQWQSLMRRKASYAFLRNPAASITNVEEEGTMSFGTTRPLDTPRRPIRDVYTHENLAQWEGWSLVVARIGRSIDTEDELSTGTPKARDESIPDDVFAYKLATSFSVPPASLPRLRFGRRYRIRARMADIAGTGRRFDGIDPADVDCATALVEYQRWDPVTSPALALTKKPVEGESLERMVIRNYNDGEVGSEPATSEVSTRAMYPPVASVELCERHGRFDSSPTGPMRTDVYAMLVAKTTMKTSDLPYQWYKPQKTSKTIADGSTVTVTELKELGPLNTDPGEADAAVGIRYPIVGGSSLPAPYLPDPMARGICLQNVPGLAAGQLREITLTGENSAAIASSGGVVTVCFDDDSAWPDTRSILLSLAEGTGAPSWSPDKRLLTVYLAKGEQAWMTFGSSVGETLAEAQTNLETIGLWDAYKGAGHMAARLEALARGLGWIVTPGRTLHLVHATQRPLTKPEVGAIPVNERAFGATWVDLRFDPVTVHGKTTQKVDVTATWSMDTDDPLKPEPEAVPAAAFVYEQHVEDRLVNTLAKDHRQEFGDTKHRMVRYIPMATTRFREYLPSDLAFDTSRLTRSGEGKEINILSTRRPESVDLVYAVPSFKWLDPDKTPVDGVITSRRKGGGIRVYMKRPWYSSGNGELLGVILYSTQKISPSKKDDKGSGKSSDKNDVKGADKKNSTSNSIQYDKSIIKAVKPSDFALMPAESLASVLQQGQVNIPENLATYVTQWGLDPIWLSAPTPSDSAPRVANFVNPVAVQNSVSIPEIDRTQRFIVVGYKPTFDKDRNLWYCDIELDPGESYYPFVRLALCRFQPNSLADASTGEDVYVSSVIQSEFCQLAPDRTAMARVEDDGMAITIQVTGNTYRMNAAGHQGSEIEVTLEKRSGSGELGWSPVVTQRIDRIPSANMWGGMLALTEAVNANFRLVVKEYEMFWSDPDGKERATSLGSKGRDDGDVTFGLDRRIVYADILPLG